MLIYEFFLSTITVLLYTDENEIYYESLECIFEQYKEPRPESELTEEEPIFF